MGISHRIGKVVFMALAVGAMTVAGLSGCGGSSAQGSSAALPNAAGPRFNHVFLIVGENTSFAQITPSHAPYLSNTLKPRSAWLTHYRSFKESSSLGQYIAIVSGQYTKCESNNDLPAHCHQNVANLFQQLNSSGRSWRDWNESMDNACDYVDHGSAWSRNIYSAHHNAAIYFTGIEGGVYDEAKTPSSSCRQDDLSTGSTAPNDTSTFDAALSDGKVGNFNLIVPNDCENGHDPCGTQDPVKQFDDFLAREVPKIESSPAFGSDGLIVVTWDEGADPPQDPAHVLTLFVGPSVRPGVYGGKSVDHFSLARSLADGFRVSRLAHERSARSLPAIWK